MDYLYDKLQQLFEDYLRENNHRITPERFIVLRTITMTPSDFTAYDLLCTLTRPNGEQEVTKTSIYSTVNLLEKAKLIEWIPQRSSELHFRVNKDSYLE